MNKPPNLPTATIGAISVHRVITDLLLKGYHVFEEVGFASCDLGVLRKDKFVRVEVTTGKYIPSGGFFSPPHDKLKYDILATVLPDKIIYQPQL